MIGTIDRDVDIKDIKLSLHKPNGVKIGILKEAYDISLKMKLTGVSELNFTVPYHIIKNGSKKKNKSVDKLLFKYLIKVEVAGRDSWFVIEDKTKDVNDTEDSITFKAFSLQYELSYKYVTNYLGESVTISEVAIDLLKDTNWSLSHVDEWFSNKRRQIDQTNKSALDIFRDIEETYNAVLIWDTNKRELSIKKPSEIGENKGLSIRYGKYLKSLQDNTHGRDFCTRLKVFGSDGLSIQEVSPAGVNYIEDFSYFMRGFQRDSSKRTISSSKYMSDGLCHAILDYDEIIKSKDGIYSMYLEELNDLFNQLSELEFEKFNLGRALSETKDRIDIQVRGNDYYEYINDLDANQIVEESVSLKYGSRHALLIRSSKEMKVSLSGDQSETYTSVDGEWLHYIIPSRVYLSGGIDEYILDIKIENISDESNDIEVIIPRILPNEFSDESIEKESFLERYSIPYNQEKVDYMENLIDEKNIEIEMVNQDIEDFKEDISIENHFTESQIEERRLFIIEKVYENQDIIDKNELYEAAKEKMQEVSKPPLVINIDSVNFLKVVEAQRDWDKLVLGDIVSIRYVEFDLNVTARVVEIDYDFESDNINLVISDVKRVDGDSDRLKNFISSSISTSSQVSTGKPKWDTADQRAIDAVSSTISNTRSDLSTETKLSSEEAIWANAGLTLQDKRDLEDAIGNKVSIDYVDGKLELKADFTEVNEIREDLLNKAGIEYVDGKLQLKADADDVEAEIAKIRDDLLEKAGVEYVDGQLQSKADREELEDAKQAIESVQSNVENAQSRVSEVESDLDGVKTDILSKVDAEYVDGQLQTKADINTVYTIEEIDNAFNNVVSVTEYETDQNAIVARFESNESQISQNSDEISSKVSRTEYQELEDNVSGFDSRIETAESSVSQMADQIQSKVSITEYEEDKDSFNSRISNAESSIAQNADLISSKVSQTDFDSVEGRLESAESSITQQADLIKSKVSTTDFEELEGAFGSVESRVSSAESTISQQADEIAQKVSTTEFNDLDGRVSTAESSIIQNANEISSKVSQSDYDEYRLDMDTRVSNAETSITQNESEIQSRATKTEVDAIEGRVSDAESNITQNANEISSKVSKTEFNAVEDRVSSAESSITQQADLIESKVSKTEFNESIEDLDDKFNDYSTTSQVESKISQSADSITQSVSQTYATKNELSGEISAVGSRISTVEQDLDGVTTTVSSVSSDLNSLSQDVSSVEQTVNGITSTVSSLESDVGSVESRISSAESSITQNADAISQRVTKSDFNKAESRLSSAESTISQNSSAINLRATKTEVDTVKERVSSAESQLSIQAGEISSRVKEEDFESFFTQTAQDFTFSANQIDFKGATSFILGEGSTHQTEVNGGELITTMLRIRSLGSWGSLHFKDLGSNNHNAILEVNEDGELRSWTTKNTTNKQFLHRGNFGTTGFNEVPRGYDFNQLKLRVDGIDENLTNFIESSGFDVQWGDNRYYQRDGSTPLSDTLQYKRSSSGRNVSAIRIENPTTGDNTSASIDFAFSTAPDHYHSRIMSTRTNEGGSHSSRMDFFARRSSAGSGEDLLSSVMSMGYNGNSPYILFRRGNDLVNLSDEFDKKSDNGHTHSISDVGGLQTTLNSKVSTSRSVSSGTGLSGGGNLSSNRTLSLDTSYTDGRYARSSHSHSISDVTGLNNALSNKADQDHTHSWSSITSKPSTFTPSSHTHSASEITSGTISTSRLPSSALVGDTTYSAGTGISLSGTTFNVDNPFNPSGSYSSLRARATTKADVGLGNVDNYSRSHYDNRYLNLTGNDTVAGSPRFAGAPEFSGTMIISGKVSSGSYSSSVEIISDVLVDDNDLHVKNGAVKIEKGGKSAKMVYNDDTDSLDFVF